MWNMIDEIYIRANTFFFFFFFINDKSRSCITEFINLYVMGLFEYRVARRMEISMCNNTNDLSQFV